MRGLQKHRIGQFRHRPLVISNKSAGKLILVFVGPPGLIVFQNFYLFAIRLREFVLNSRHPDPWRVCKGGPDGGLRDTIRGNLGNLGMSSKKQFFDGRRGA